MNINATGVYFGTSNSTVLYPTRDNTYDIGYENRFIGSTANLGKTFRFKDIITSFMHDPNDPDLPEQYTNAYPSAYICLNDSPDGLYKQGHMYRGSGTNPQELTLTDITPTTTVDSELSTTSTNAIQNSTVANIINSLQTRIQALEQLLKGETQ